MSKLNQFELDVESLLQPIDDDNPSGVSLAYEPEYDQIRKARRSDDNLARGVWAKEAKVADWDLVLQIGTEALLTRTKDLQIAAWITEALGHQHGFAGFRDGLRLLQGIQTRFWETYHPQIEDGDVESRVGPFQFMNDPFKGLPFLIAGIALTRGGNDEAYSYRRFRESRDTDNAVAKNSSSARTLLAEGKIDGKEFDKAVAQTSKAFYLELVANLQACVSTFKAFETETDARFGPDAPSLLNIGKALNACLAWAEPILAQKRLAEPDPVEEVKPEPVAAPLTNGDAATDPGLTSVGGSGLVIGPVGVPNRKVVVPAGPDLHAPDYGLLLIEFQERAKQLAEAGVRLKANREKYAELLAELKKLDEEYDTVSRLVSESQEGYQLISRLSKVSGMALPPN